MIKKNIFTLGLILGFLIPNIIFGQVSSKSVHFAITDNNIDYLPTDNLLGFAAGINFREKQGRHFKNTFGVEVSYYRVEKIEQSFMLDATYSFGYVFNFGLEAKLLADLGYKNSAFTGDVYRFSDGKYKKSNRITGKSQANLKLGFGLDLPLNNKYSIFAFAKLNGFFPSILIPHVIFGINEELGLGVKYIFNQKK